jgi:hypothetical protein
MIKNVELALRVTHMHQSQLSRSALSQSQQPAERASLRRSATVASRYAKRERDTRSESAP